METILFPEAEAIRFGVVLFRVAGIMIFAPVFSSGMLPVRVKLSLALVASLAMSPSLPMSGVPADFTLGPMLLWGLGEVVIGMVIGLTATFVFAGLQLAGQLIGFQLGFSLINIIDPQTQVESSVLSILENFIGLTFFLLLNGHHWFFLAVSESFSFLPPGGVTLRGPVVEEIVRLSSQILVAGIQIAAPVIAVTIISDMVLGVIGRAAPLVNVLIVGMPLKTLVGFVCLSIAFYFMPHLLASQFTKLHRDIYMLLRGLA